MEGRQCDGAGFEKGGSGAPRTVDREKQEGEMGERGLCVYRQRFRKVQEGFENEQVVPFNCHTRGQLDEERGLEF